MSEQTEAVDFNSQPPLANESNSGADTSKKRLLIFAAIGLVVFGGVWGMKKYNAGQEAKNPEGIALATTPEKLKEPGSADAGSLPGADDHSQPAAYPTADALLNGQQADRQKDAVASGGGAYVAEVGALNERGEAYPQQPGGGQGYGNQMPPIPQGQMPTPIDAQTVQSRSKWMEKYQNNPPKAEGQQQQERRIVNWYGSGAVPGNSKNDVAGQLQVSAQTSAPQGQKVASIGERVAAVTTNHTSSYQQGTTVIVRIVEDGPKRDAQLFGTYTEGYDALVVKLSKMRLADGRIVPVDAVLVDKSTNSQAVVSAVQGHYLDRFGMLAAGAFLGNYATALTSGGTTTVVNGGSVTAVPKIDQPAKYAVGKTVEAISQLATAGAAKFNKSEVILKRNELVGVLFLDDAVAGAK